MVSEITPLGIRLLVVYLTIALLLNGCLTSRPILSKGNPSRISTRLKEKDVNKPIRIFRKNGDIIDGKLVDFDSVCLVILDTESSQKKNLPMNTIEKVELKEKNYTPIAFVVFIGLMVGIHKVNKDLHEAFQSLGH